ncbi:patatin-like phospholipase family protein [Desulfurispira natronophila]|uniref:NTE family protein n=1 Tax=Desulfurispira natronophila TaxID=682562 RepID=A0A7W8DH55_9BACT|nr:patatin-like phospholipase family protein [Desulfurispira natronophila]MBB5022216.1 NTE family protein [Desulfurispira natronophila]
MIEPTISLALGGGGARGIAHLGVLRALEEAEIRPSLLVGTSMGAVIGAMYAYYRKTADVEKNIEALVNSDFMRITGLDGYAAPSNSIEKKGLDYVFSRLRKNMQLTRVFTRSGTIPSEALLQAMEHLIDDVNIEDLAIPFCAVATDLAAGKPVLFTSGPVRVAMAASATIPGVFSPLEYQDMQLIDGAASYLTPTPPARQMSDAPVIAVDVSKSLELPFTDRGYGVYCRSSDIAMTNYNTLLVGQADMVIRPDVALVSWADFHRYQELIDMGYAACQEAMPEITAIVKKGRSPLRRWWQRWRNTFNAND